MKDSGLRKGTNFMIVVVEGIDRVGKTTLAKMLEAAGFVYLKDEFVLDLYKDKMEFAQYSIGKCDSFVAVAKALDKQGKNVVIDRLHFTELVYGFFDRQSNVDVHACFEIDMELTRLGAILCLVQPADIELSNKLANEDMTDKSELFNSYIKLSGMNKILCNYDTLDETVNMIVDSTLSYDFYFASPFFNDEQVEREERMIAHLRGLGFTVFSPKENCNLGSTADNESRQRVFEENCNAIRRSKMVFAVTDGKDIGTIWEAGYAFGINKPVAYFAETLGTNQFNLMLAQSGVDVFLSQDEVTFEALVNILRGGKRIFKGEIE